MIIKIKYCQFWGMLIFMLLLSNSVAGQNNVESSKAPKLSTQSSAGFVMYTYDSESPIGISFGRINKNRIGGYANIKFNPEIFTGFDVLYKIDDEGNHDGLYDFVSSTGEIRKANVSISGGITFKILYPMWMHIGLGVGYYPVYEEYDQYEFRSFDNKRIEGDTEFFKNTDKTKFDVFPETGLDLKISDVLVLKYGIMYRQAVIHQFGLGFQI
ncbi:MAG: hypothetical protein CMP48_02320 [Rickettsiales bacterium]|nr:hypothetical protein [Rickettsiales bacterium]